LPVPVWISSKDNSVAPVFASTMVCSRLGVWSARTPRVSTSSASFGVAFGTACVMVPLSSVRLSTGEFNMHRLGGSSAEGSRQPEPERAGHLGAVPGPS